MPIVKKPTVGGNPFFAKYAKYAYNFFSGRYDHVTIVVYDDVFHKLSAMSINIMVKDNPSPCGIKLLYHFILLCWPASWDKAWNKMGMSWILYSEDI